LCSYLIFFLISSLTNQFTGVHNGRLGGLVGSPVFGPGGVGPFNNPNVRDDRILSLLNINRDISDENRLRD